MASPGTRRRDLLHPERMAALAAAALPRVPADIEAVPDELIRAGRPAMACLFEIFLSTRDRSRIMTVHRALDLVQELEGQMTVFRDDSEIAHLNRSAFERPISTETGLFELLRLGARIHRETGGAFDLTAGPLWKAWGFSRRQGTLPDPEAIEKARSRVGSRFLELNPSTGTVRFRRRGLELNLGAIGKGYALDRAGRRLKEEGIGRALLHAGYSSMLALGDGPGKGPSPGWKVSIRDPLGRTGPLATVQLRNRALSTSGAGEQFFRIGNRRYGHVLDPRTGHPVDKNLAATALAPTAAEADALATAFLVMDLEDILSYCRQRPGIGAIMVAKDPRDRAIRVHHWGLDADHLEVFR